MAELAKLLFISGFVVCFHQILSKASLSRPWNIRVSTSSDPTQFDIFWSPPEQTDGQIRGYEIRFTNDYSLKERKWERKPVSGLKTTVRLTNLIPYTTYYVVVRAQINNEIGSPSEVLEFITKTSSPHSGSDDSKPKITAIISGQTWSTAEITWRAPKARKGKIKSYEISYTTDISRLNVVSKVKIVDQIKNIYDIEEMVATVDNLLPNTDYKFTVKVKSSEDSVGLLSDVFEYKTRPMHGKSDVKTFYESCAEIFSILLGPLILILIIYLFYKAIGVSGYSGKLSVKKDYYKILKVRKSATNEEIKTSYHKLAKTHHPDRHSDATEQVRHREGLLMQELNVAYNVLIDPITRHEFDNSIR